MSKKQNTLNELETATPIFCLSLSFTNASLKKDVEQTAILETAAETAEQKEIVKEIRKCFDEAYEKVSGLFEQYLKELYGDEIIDAKQIADTTKTILFRLKEDNYD